MFLTLITAWEWLSPDNLLVSEIIESSGPMLRPGPFKATPIVVDGSMYLPTTYGQIASLDPATGETRWVFDTRTYDDGRPTNLGFNVRGVAYWEQSGKTRIFLLQIIHTYGLLMRGLVSLILNSVRMGG